VSARILAQALADGPGWQLVVENRPGATGRIGTELAAKAPPDGYTLLLGTAGPNSILPGAGAKLPYDAVKDFLPVTLVDSAAYVLVVHPSLPVKTVRDMIVLARSKPGQIPFASAGNLSVGHMAAELFKYHAKIDMTHVPYKGGGPAVVATMSGETVLYFGGVSIVEQSRAGKLRAIASTGTKRAGVPGTADGRRNAAGLRDRPVGRGPRARGHAAGHRVGPARHDRESPGHPLGDRAIHERGHRSASPARRKSSRPTSGRRSPGGRRF